MTQTVKLLLVLVTLAISGFIGFNIADKTYTPKSYSKEQKEIKKDDIKGIGIFTLGSHKSQYDSIIKDNKYSNSFKSRYQYLPNHKEYSITYKLNSSVNNIKINLAFYNDTLYYITIYSKNNYDVFQDIKNALMYKYPNYEYNNDGSIYWLNIKNSNYSMLSSSFGLLLYDQSTNIRVIEDAIYTRKTKAITKMKGI